ncbi:MAG: hypothetical protein V3T69_04450, partial [Acidiferrobacterales bacterium]
SKFSASSASCRELMLDWVLRAISEFHAADAEFRLPPRPKIATAPVRPENFPISSEKGLFQQNSDALPTLGPECRLTAALQT